MTFKILTSLAAVVTLAACDPMGMQDMTAQNAAMGAAAGAAIGAAVTEDDPVQGAVIGGTVGMVAATLIGKSTTPGQCLYRDAYGRTFLAAC